MSELINFSFLQAKWAIALKSKKLQVASPMRWIKEMSNILAMKNLYRKTQDIYIFLMFRMSGFFLHLVTFKTNANHILGRKQILKDTTVTKA